MHKKIPFNINVFFFSFYKFLLPLKKKQQKKQAPKMPDFNTNQNFAVNIASSIEGLSMANQIFLLF